MWYNNLEVVSMDDIKYLKISELNRIIKMKFDASKFFSKVFVSGEISNFKVQMPSGHCYFTLKDENSRLAAVMFRATASKVGTNFKDGDMVNAIGKISVYEGSGTYQIYIESMELSGSGDLYKKFLELKEKLFKQGWFDLDKKKPIPKFPKRIGVVTASTGAAIRDIITTIRRRYPLCEIILFPSLVQGNTAKDDIVNKIKLSCNYDIDTLIVGRGGGSIEDLWAYNEEIVAKAIYECPIPVISAVGHEIDFSISDFVADLRAPTPTAAAELAVPDINTIVSYLNTVRTRAYNGVNQLIINNQLLITKIKDSYVLTHPMALFERKEQKLDTLIDKLNKEITIILDKQDIKLKHIISSLQVLNPLNTLNRGYAIIRKDNKVISSVKKIKKDDEVIINLKDGIITSKVIKVGE